MFFVNYKKDKKHKEKFHERVCFNKEYYLHIVLTLTLVVTMAEISINLNEFSDNNRKNFVGTSASTKIQIVPAQPKTLSHLPERPPVELAFRDLTYKVREGRSNSKYIYQYENV